MSHRKSWIAVVQTTCTNDKVQNLETCQSLIEKAQGRGAAMAFLPEAFDFLGENAGETKSLAEELSGPTIGHYRDLAGKLKMSLSLGGFHRLAGEKMLNTHVIIDAQGQITGQYAKTHLFDVDIPGRVKLKESDYVLPGPAIPDPVTTSVGRVGLGICYDLRFPELSLGLARKGADILTFPATFTIPTGMAHWEVLLRARAIETQCYVIAAAQTGQHNAKRSSYGHSMVVDPWGTTRTAIVSVNKKPVLPGHLLVIPKRKAQRLGDLNADEIADLFLAVQRAEKLTERHFQCSSSTINLQDGPEAGQSINHVHVHVLPRRAGDFRRSDDIYNELETHDKGENIIWRSEAEMASEAGELRQTLSEMNSL
eukprot:snap_masked-scaffold856_size87843-processed-gene-0.10 protein:Tk08373 transcript:snap_masked-scaffold856_size87843-processed-gene-0.10-mRNA-1 annotation:"histidine triad domain protein"